MINSQLDRANGRRTRKRARRVLFFARFMSLPFYFDFIAKEVFDGLAFADEAHPTFLRENFCWEGSAVVMGCHAETIGSSGEDGEEGSAVEFGELAVFSQKVGAFADRSNDVDGFFDGLLLDGGWDDFVLGIVESRADKLTHGSVDDEEVLFFAFFSFKDTGEEAAGISEEIAAWLQEEAKSARQEEFFETFCKFVEFEGFFEGAADTEASTGIVGLDAFSVGLVGIHEGHDEGGGFEERGGVQDERAEMDVV